MVYFLNTQAAKVSSLFSKLDYLAYQKTSVNLKTLRCGSFVDVECYVNVYATVNLTAFYGHTAPSS